MMDKKSKLLLEKPTLMTQYRSLYKEEAFGLAARLVKTICGSNDSVDENPLMCILFRLLDCETKLSYTSGYIENIYWYLKSIDFNRNRSYQLVSARAEYPEVLQKLMDVVDEEHLFKRLRKQEVL